MLTLAYLTLAAEKEEFEHHKSTLNHCLKLNQYSSFIL